MRKPRLIVVSGLSGSGKSTAMRILEDIGFFCVDNLPVVLLPKLIELCLQSSEEINKIAVDIDIRERVFLNEYSSILDNLTNSGYSPEVVFLEASDEALLRRFSETRRRHPLSEHGSVLKGISRERDILENLKHRARLIVDTSNLTIHQLRDDISKYVLVGSEHKKMDIVLMSFGYKYGIPVEADLVIDVRFMPNPNFVQKLKPLTGVDSKVMRYVFREVMTNKFLKKMLDLLNFLVPLYEREGKSYLTIAFGCTGGRHRSVAMVQKLLSNFRRGKYNIKVKHRDIGK